MNTIPDEALLALWLDDELHGEESANVEAWAESQPDQLAAREEVRAWRRMMSEAMPAVEEPPYPDFFNSRVEKAIREQMSAAAPAAASAVEAKRSFWSWLFPATAFAGMALAFWVGTKTHTEGGGAVAKSVPVWYTPEQGVDVKWLKGSGADSSVIVLQGVNAIPDTLDFTETALYQMERESSTTAGTDALPKGNAR